MKRKIFKYKPVYYLAVIVSLLLFILSAFSLLGLFNNFSIFKTLIIGISLVINSFAFINLIEKYDKAVVFLNLSLFLAIFIMGYPLLIGFLKGYNILENYRFKFLVSFILILIIVNVFKIKEHKGINEIEDIGTGND
ncbi:hypothetical protein [Chryseobacterium taiwanense]|uniref:Uncharacterized protein n=1 Tax=Chryseobacterium taiwanense TaxID=363331 RepID=A0A0B4D5U2_9FLAO|nr:hypothetical protein [Chryseobacterium taiwanense]KIC64102.1 hypothetical protein RM51_05145 [Chryseobacterium taiwanense]